MTKKTTTFKDACIGLFVFFFSKIDFKCQFFKSAVKKLLLWHIYCMIKANT